jgi:hypothetical protein
METEQKEYRLQQPLHYKNYVVVKPFGRERDKDGAVEYYWVVDPAGNRFKAYPNELKPC